MLANATLWSIEPIAAPTIKVAATTITKVSALRCFVIIFMILSFIDIIVISTTFKYKGVIIFDAFLKDLTKTL